MPVLDQPLALALAICQPRGWHGAEKHFEDCSIASDGRGSGCFKEPLRQHLQ